MKPEDARVGMWVSVSFTAQIKGIHVDPEFVELNVKNLRCNVPIENVEILSETETLGTD